MTSKINTTEIGDRFEKKSLEIIKKVIEEEQLGLLSEYIRIFQKKEYTSNLRQKKIKFDLTIEVWPPGANRYVLLYIIECKDYATRVPVNKIEDFHSKIQQVAGVNVKGIFISNSPLQEGAYNIAESVGMMVIQGESSDDYNIILHKKNISGSDNKIPFIQGTSVNSIIDFGIEQIEKLIDKKILNSFQEISNCSRISYGIDKISKIEIEQKAYKELDCLNPQILKDGYPLKIKDLIEFMNNKFGIKISYFECDNVYGKCNIKDGIINVSKSIQGTNRELFVLSHELGHYFLHQKLSIGQKLYDLFDDPVYNFKTGSYDLVNPRNWIEWQANCFASYFTMPNAPFLARVWMSQDTLYGRRGRIYLDDQKENVSRYMELISRLSYKFNVSKASIIYKLKDLDLINNNSRLKSIGQIVIECEEEFLI